MQCQTLSEIKAELLYKDTVIHDSHKYAQYF